MAENIRKQFTPIRKRLSTRIQEATSALHDTDVTRLRRLRTKLIANMETHERLYTKINQLSGVSQNCQRLLDEEIEMSTELSMDANEAYQALRYVIILVRLMPYDYLSQFHTTAVEPQELKLLY